MGGGGQISPFPIDFYRRPYNTPRTNVRVCDPAALRLVYLGYPLAQHEYNDAISGVRISPGSAETLVARGGKINYRLIPYL